MDHTHPTSLLDLPSVQVELSIRQAFGLAYALASYLSRLGGPATGLQRELASVVLDLRQRLPAQCQEILDGSARLPLTGSP